MNNNQQTTSSNTTATSGFTALRTIKGTACNKDRARTWLEVPQSELMAYGFARGERINVTFNSDNISVTLDPEGKRKVAGRARGGKVICILDMCCPMDQRAAMFNGAAELDVSIKHGQIVIKARA